MEKQMKTHLKYKNFNCLKKLQKLKIFQSYATYTLWEQ